LNVNIMNLGPKSTMTNGTVGNVVVSSGRTITVKYPGLLE
jgi:hypothetical protein